MKGEDCLPRLCCCCPPAGDSPPPAARESPPPVIEETEMADDEPDRRPLAPNDGGMPGHLGPWKQLHSGTGYNLALGPGGQVYGTRDPFSDEAILEISSQAPGEVHIKGHAAQLFVAMDENGKVYAEEDPESPNCVWLEHYEDGWNRYIWKGQADDNWFLGIKKSGKPKRGDKTKLGQKAIRFIPRPARPKDE